MNNQLTLEQLDANARTIVARMTGYIQSVLKYEGSTQEIAKYLMELHREFPINPSFSEDAANELEKLLNQTK